MDCLADWICISEQILFYNLSDEAHPCRTGHVFLGYEASSARVEIAQIPPYRSNPEYPGDGIPVPIFHLDFLSVFYRRDSINISDVLTYSFNIFFGKRYR